MQNLPSMLAVLLLATPTVATLGVDVSYPPSSWSCLKSNGVSFAVVRVGRSTGHVDPNGRAMAQGALNAGIKYVDGYLFPCYKCGNPAGQVRQVVFNLKSSSGINSTVNATEGMAYREQGYNGTSAGMIIGMLWLDIEGTQYWSSSTSSNLNFIAGMVNEAESLGVKLGFYTSKFQWNPIAGGSTKYGKYPLWYAHYDNNPSFSDFSPFGGWSKPAIKQYKGDTTMCSSGVDLNYY